MSLINYACENEAYPAFSLTRLKRLRMMHVPRDVVTWKRVWCVILSELSEDHLVFPSWDSCLRQPRRNPPMKVLYQFSFFPPSSPKPNAFFIFPTLLLAKALPFRVPTTNALTPLLASDSASGTPD